MKILFKYITLLFIGITLFSCDYDNYDGPNAKLHGSLSYQNEGINLGYNDVKFLLFEPKYDETPGSMDVFIDTDGSFSSALFDSQYKIVFVSQALEQYPFVLGTESDTIDVTVSGNTEFNIPVTPYYTVSNPAYTVTDSIRVSFGVNQIIDGANAKNVERVSFYLGKTRFVDDGNNIQGDKVSSDDDDNLQGAANIAVDENTDLSSFNMVLPKPDFIHDQNYVFGRIGIKLAGVQYMIFSPVQKIDL